MRFAKEIEGCFESVFREFGSSDDQWNLKYAHFLTILDIRYIEKWIITLLNEGMTKNKAIHRVEQYLNERNEKHSH